LTVLAVSPAQAVVLDFESLALNNTNLNNVETTYTEDGFTLSEAGSQIGRFASWGTLAPQSPGSTALFSNNINGAIRLTQVGGDDLRCGIWGRTQAEASQSESG
jgi:hypothetical protein